MAAYARVSTLLGQQPDNQLVPIREVARNRSFILVEEYVDQGISGTKERRPGLDKLIKDARIGHFKIVIVSGIDRIARNTRHLLNLIAELESYGVALISLRESLDFTTPMGKATLTILGAIAELERELTRERIRTALAAKKVVAQKTGSGWRCGRPDKVTDELYQKVLDLRAEGLSIRGIERELKGAIAKSSIARILKDCPKNLKNSVPQVAEFQALRA